MLLKGPCLTREKPLSEESLSVSTIQSQYLTQNGQRRKVQKTEREAEPHPKGLKTDRKAEQHRKEWKGRRDAKLPRRLEFC